MRVEIAKLHTTLGNTMIYVTHDQTEAMTLADRIVVLRSGVVEQVGSPLELYQDPDNAFVAGFIGSPRMNFLAARATGVGEVEVAGAKVFLPNLGTKLVVGQEYRFGIRPEHLNEGQGAELELTVDVAEQLGSTTYLHGTLNGGEAIVAERRGSAPKNGESVALRFAPEHVRIFDGQGARVR